MIRKTLIFAVLLLITALTATTLSQTITGRISGAVTDSTGAAVPGVAVKITNEATQQTRSAMTDPNGFYVATNLPVGNYTVTVEHQGFKRATKTGYNLIADGRLSVDFALETGAVTESVEIVAATGEAVNSVSGEVARTVDQSQVQELALNGRNYLQLTTLIPGAPLLEDNALSLTTSLSTSQPINGNRGNANNLTVDGGFNLDSGSNGSQINNVGIDFIREVSIKTSNFSAEYGRNSGASINVVTRSGENKYHGGAFENVRNDKFDANETFNVSRNVRRPTLRFNNFGFSFGGPIIKDKFFAFGGVEWKIIRQYTASQTRTLPTSAELSGDFSARSTVFLKDPTKTGTCNATTQTACFPNPKILPANLITTDGKAIAAVFRAMSKRAVSYIDTPTANNALYQELNPFHSREDLLRLDYRINSAHNVYGRYIHDKYDLIDPFGTFINAQLPTIPTNRLRPGTSYQAGYTWMIRPTLINELKANAAWNGQRVPPVGDAWKRETYGFAFQQLFSGGGRYENGIPNVNVNGFATFTGPSASLLSPTTDISITDSITWVRGSHTLKTGFVYIRNRKDQNGRPNYTGNVTFNASGNTSSTGNSVADALLGNFRTYTESDLDPVAFFRFSQYDAYATNSWKATRKLSLEFGVRYQYGLPTYAQQNNMANFDPSRYDPTKAVTVLANGNIDVSKGGNFYNGLVRVGSGVPQSELNRVPNGNSALVLSVPSGAPRGTYEPQHLFAPRFSFAFAPFNNKTAIRGGFGMFYDKPEGNLIFSQVNLPPFTGSAAVENGNLASLASARASAVTPFAGISAIDPNLVVPYTMSYSLSIQHELPKGIFVEAAYVGNQGRHLLRQPDINQPSFAALRANALLPTAQRLTTNAMRPYKGFSAINMRLSDSNSNYNSLQLYAAKRRGNTTMTVSYTFSKALSDSSGNGDNPEEFSSRSFNYGPTSFDRRQIFVATYTYRLPFFNKLKSKSLAGNLLKGWETSGITRFQTGQYYTPQANSTIGTRRADYLGGDITLPDNERGQSRWFNTAAFGSAPEDRRGNASPGSILGPGRHVWDLSLRKQFALTEAVRLQFRGDMFNMFNHVNLSLNNGGLVTNQAAANYGTITNAAPGRQVQLGLRLTF